MSMWSVLLRKPSQTIKQKILVENHVIAYLKTLQGTNAMAQLLGNVLGKYLQMTTLSIVFTIEVHHCVSETDGQ